MLQLNPDVEHGVVEATNTLPPEWGWLRISGLAIGHKQVNIDTAKLPPAQ